jgi:hypothetical protein
VSDAEEKYVLYFERRKDYLFAKVSAAVFDAASLLEAMGRVAIELNKTHCRRLLLVRDIRASPPQRPRDPPLLRFVQFSHWMRIAIVNPFPDLHERTINAIRDREPDTNDAAVFEDVTQAEEWLLSADPPEPFRREAKIDGG